MWPHRRQPTRLPRPWDSPGKNTRVGCHSPKHESEKWKWSRLVVSDSWRPHGLQPTRPLHPWDFPGKSTGVGCHCLLRGVPLPSPDDAADVVNLISGSSAFSKTSLNICKFTVHMLLKPGLENFEHYFTSIWDECNCAVVWAFFGIAFLRDWNEDWPFPVLWPLLSFPNLLAYWVQHFHSIIFQDLK